MNKWQILGLTFFSLLAVAGLVTANGVTGNLIAGCDCIGNACLKTCGAGIQCCTTATGDSKQVPEIPKWPGYLTSFVGLAGFFTIIAFNTKEEDMY